LARILVIDDDAFTCRLIKDILKKYADKEYESKWPLTIDLLDSAVKALEVVKESNYELIITDILMARMDGWEFIRELRKKFPQFAVPIVVISAVRGIDLKYEGMRHGASAWFYKPLKPEKFAKGVFKLVQGR
jgi:CheY-like chemotaxis protein